MTFYLSCSNSTFPPFDPSVAHVPTVRWIRYRGLQSVRVAASPTPNAAGQPIKIAQILYETPQLAAVAKENLDGFALKKGWVMSVSYV
jgi:U2 small nuclear ribonucleoprotein B''